MIVGGNYNLPPGTTEQQINAEWEDDCEQEFYQHKFTPYIAPVLSPGPLFDWANEKETT